MDNTLSAVYRSQDSIDNLLLRVSLRRRVAPGQPPVDAVSSTYGSSAPNAETEVSIETHHELCWQQKLFGPAELIALVTAVEDRRAGRAVTTVDGAGGLAREYMDEVERRIAADGLDALLAVPADGVLLYTITDRDARQPLSVRVSRRALLSRHIMRAMQRAPSLSHTRFRPSATTSPPHHHHHHRSQELTRFFLNARENVLSHEEPDAPVVAAEVARLPGDAGAAVAAPGAPPNPGVFSFFRKSLTSLPGLPGGAAGGGGSLPSPQASVPSSTSARSAFEAMLAAGSVVGGGGEGQSVFSHASRGAPTTMFVMSAAGLAPGTLRAAVDAAIAARVAGAPAPALPAWTDVPLVAAFWHGGGRGGGTGLLELRPGFAEPVPYERAALLALSSSLTGGDASETTNGAVMSLINSDASLGSGRYGGRLRLRPLPPSLLPGAGSAAVAALSSTVGRPPRPVAGAPDAMKGTVAFALEMHRVKAGATQLEYALVNPDEDIFTLIESMTAR
jgi:hypothetical protein